jgi:hypothetical protein
MRYLKPSITEIGIASLQVQGQGDKTMPQVDANPNDTHPSTGGCYDLDGE